MLKLVILFVLIALGFVFGPVLIHNQGYVLVSIANYTVEMSVLALVITLLLLWGAIALLLYLLRGGTKLAQGGVDWIRGVNLTQRQLQQSLDSLFQGDWQQAQKFAQKSQKLSHWPEFNAYTSAWAAKQLQQPEQALQQLEQVADSADPVTLAMLRADILQQQDKIEQALQLLEDTAASFPKHGLLQARVADAYAKGKHYDKLAPMMPQLIKQKTLSENQKQTWQKALYQWQLQQAASLGHAELDKAWQHLPKPEKQNIQLQSQYCRSLFHLGQTDKALQQTLNYLKQSPTPELVEVLADQNLPEPEQLLHRVRNWQQKQSEAYQALLGVLARKAHLLKDASQYLQQAYHYAHRVSIGQWLADVMLEMGDTQSAGQLYRQLLQQKSS